MGLHHVIPKFHLKRWVNPDHRLEVIDAETWQLSTEDPETFFAIPGFNRYERRDGGDDPWLEHVFLGGLDSDAARLMTQLEHLPPPRSHLKNARKRGWHLTHILSPKASARLAMYVAGQAVRTAVWREAVRQQTAETMRDYVEEKVARDLASATDPAEIERLQGMQGLRYFVTEITGNLVPHLSAHLAYRLGEVLYRDYSWSVVTVPEPALMLGDDPVVIANFRRERFLGSYAQLAKARGRALSVYKSEDEISNDAVAALTGSDLIVLPLDPRRLLMLSNVELLGLPGRHDRDLSWAVIANAGTRLACRRWICLPPGHFDEAREAIYRAHPWRRKFDERSAA